MCTMEIKFICFVRFCLLSVWNKAKNKRKKYETFIFSSGFFYYILINHLDHIQIYLFMELVSVGKF